MVEYEFSGIIKFFILTFLFLFLIEIILMFLSQPFDCKLFDMYIYSKSYL